MALSEARDSAGWAADARERDPMAPSQTPLVNTKRAAEDAERAHVMRVLGGEPAKPVRPKEVPRFEAFADQFLELAALKNKPSEVQTKESTLRVHLKPHFGQKRLDEMKGLQRRDRDAQRVMLPCSVGLAMGIGRANGGLRENDRDSLEFLATVRRCSRYGGYGE